MFTSNIVPQTGVLVTVSWGTRWSRGTRITRPPWGSGVTRPTRGALAACPAFTRQTCGWEHTKSVIKKKESSMAAPGGLRIQEERAETENIHPRVHVLLAHHPYNLTLCCYDSRQSDCCRWMRVMRWDILREKGWKNGFRLSVRQAEAPVFCLKKRNGSIRARISSQHKYEINILRVALCAKCWNYCPTNIPEQQSGWRGSALPYTLLPEDSLHVF